MNDSKHPLGDFFNLGVSFAQGAMSQALKSYARLYKRMSIFVVCALFVTFLCWLINIYGERQIIHLVIILGIAASYYFLLLARNVIPISAGISIWLLGETRKTDRPWWQNLVKTYFLVISTITYTVTWPLILLTWLDFSNSPPAFWTIYAACLMIISVDIYAGKEMKWVKYFCIATPRRLFHQIATSALRLTLYSSGIF